MPPSENRSNGRISPYESRRTDLRSSSTTYRTSKDERRSEERRSDDRPRFGRSEISSPTQNHSSAKIPSGPRASTSRLTPTNSEKSLITTSLKPRVESLSDVGSDRSSSDKLAVEFVALDPTSMDVYNETFASVSQFVDIVGDMNVLKFKREKAKKSYEQKKASFEYTAMNHTTYAEIEEHQVKIRAKAKEAFEGADKQFDEKHKELAKAIESMTMRMISGGSDTKAISKEQQVVRDKLNDFEVRFNTRDDEMMKIKDTIFTLDRDARHNWEAQAKQLLAVQDELETIRAKLSVDEANNMQREDPNAAISALESRISGQMAKLREESESTTGRLRQSFEDLQTGPIQSLEKKVELVDQNANQKDLDRDKDHALLLTHDALHRQAMESQQHAFKTFGTIGKDAVALGGRMKAIEDAIAKLQAVVNKCEEAAKIQAGDHKTLTDDITGFRRRMEIVESKPSRPQSNSPAPVKSNKAKSTVNEEHEIKFEELSSKFDNLKGDFGQLEINISQRFERFQEDNDEIYGNNIDQLKLDLTELNKTFISSKSEVEALTSKYLASKTSLETVENSLETVESSLETVKSGLENLQERQSSQWTMQSSQLQNLQRDYQAIKASSRPAELPSNFAQNTTPFPHQSGSPAASNIPTQGRQSGSPIVNGPDHAQLNLKQISIRLEATELGLSHLNIRFNNLSTDALARQMWSQLDNVHPHLKDATKGLNRLEHTIGTYDGQLSRLHQKVDGLEQRSRGLPPALKEALEKVDRDVTAQRNRTDTLEMTTRSMQDQVDNIRETFVKNDPMAQNNAAARFNGATIIEGSSNDGGVVKRKAADAPNGHSKRRRNGARVIENSDNENGDQSNGLSDALFPFEKN